MVSNNGREERRRRIAERESDRMGLITGRIKNLPASSSPSSSSSLHDHIDDDTSDSTLLKHEGNDEVSRGNTFGIGCQGEPQLNKIQPSLGASVVERTSTDSEPLPKPRMQQPKLFTSRGINSCIIASESTRVISALIIAFLVVLSYVDYPLFGRNIVKSESVVASRPLYILLLTDVTIVLARLYLERRRDSDEAEEERGVPREDGHNWETAEKILERGLVVYQIVRAIFIDCSVYAVVVICGLSLL
ncbi:uncharacterized protein LOC132187466 [Corylus avellana]|uniref:uncharacterized protein LOC132187466 n=1 Tax=Corylus avellana TaxID=13451 RepID=UPI00286A6235|nr:uncharacterized protein LOC132187466 [Corylus avellana]